MATVSAKVYEHHKKSDGTYNVKICVYHKGERKFLDTNHYVVQKQLTKEKKINPAGVYLRLDQPICGNYTPSGTYSISRSAKQIYNHLQVSKRSKVRFRTKWMRRNVGPDF